MDRQTDRQTHGQTDNRMPLTVNHQRTHKNKIVSYCAPSIGIPALVKCLSKFVVCYLDIWTNGFENVMSVSRIYLVVMFHWHISTHSTDRRGNAPQSAYLTTFGLAMTLTFNLLTSKSNLFISVQTAPKL